MQRLVEIILNIQLPKFTAVIPKSFFSFQNRLATLGETERSFVSASDIDQCRAVEPLAAKDNRDYMIFYTLERVLDNLKTHFENIGK